MIGKLKGLVDSFGDDFVVIDVNGVGYVAHCSSRTLRALPKAGEAAVLSIETYVREDQIRLFGFASDQEREWFRLLLNVQGVGTKVALALLSTFRTGELATAIGMKDVAAITRTPGVGKKLAERIVLDLKDKAPTVGAVDPAAMALNDAASENRAPTAAKDAISALVNLGYGQPQAAAAIAASLKALGDSAQTSALIRQGLKELAK
jgi:Holliday junction DNA helicase RuvA